MEAGAGGNGPPRPIGPVPGKMNVEIWYFGTSPRIVFTIRSPEWVWYTAPGPVY